MRHIPGIRFDSLRRAGSRRAVAWLLVRLGAGAERDPPVSPAWPCLDTFGERARPYPWSRRARLGRKQLGYRVPRPKEPATSQRSAWPPPVKILVASFVMLKLLSKETVVPP